jgi:hypothetical protein
VLSKLLLAVTSSKLTEESLHTLSALKVLLSRMPRVAWTDMAPFRAPGASTVTLGAPGSATLKLQVAVAVWFKIVAALTCNTYSPAAVALSCAGVKVSIALLLFGGSRSAKIWSTA